MKRVTLHPRHRRDGDEALPRSKYWQNWLFSYRLHSLHWKLLSGTFYYVVGKTENLMNKTWDSITHSTDWWDVDSTTLLRVRRTFPNDTDYRGRLQGRLSILVCGLYPHFCGGLLTSRIGNSERLTPGCVVPRIHSPETTRSKEWMS